VLLLLNTEVIDNILVSLDNDGLLLFFFFRADFFSINHRLDFSLLTIIFSPLKFFISFPLHLKDLFIMGQRVWR